MSTEIRKRGRPKKVVEEMTVQVQVPIAEKKIPKTLTLGTSKPTNKPAGIPSKTAFKSNGVIGEVNGTKKGAEGYNQPPKKPKLAKPPHKVQAEDTPAPPAVASAIAVEESRILKELSQAEAKKQQEKKKPIQQVNRPIVETTPAAIVPPLEAPPSTASHLQPANTLAMGFPIPTYQSTSHTLGLQPHCLPWLPNPSPLRQAAYLSTTTPMHTSKRKLPSLKEANKFVVTEQSTRRGGPGSGAAQSRAQQLAEEARGSSKPELLRPGEMPAKYKPAGRRVQAIIVALPIVIVTSYMLYERLVLGVEPKKVARVPSGAAPSSSNESVANPE